MSEVERYRHEIPKLKTLRRKILYYVGHWSMGGFRLTETHPDARDAFNTAIPPEKANVFLAALTAKRSPTSPYP